MSVRVMAKVWDTFPGNGSELLCMLALADFANDSGFAYPAVSTLAKKVRLTRRQVQKVLRRLMEAGYLSVVGNLNGGSPKATRRYQINTDRLTGVVGDTGTGVAEDTREPEDTGELQDADGCRGGRIRVSPSSPEPLLTINEPSVSHPPRTDAPKEPQGFAEFWQTYPKKRSKGDALKAWRKLKPDAGLQVRIAEALKAAIASEDWTKESGRFIPHPATWLNAEGWEDEYISGTKPASIFEGAL